MQIFATYNSSIKVGVWNIQIKSSPEAKRDFSLLSLFPALYNSSYQSTGLGCCQLGSGSWKGPDRGFGVWVALGIHCTDVGDRFCVLKRKLIFLAGSDKITHDNFMKLVFWLEIWKSGSGTTLVFFFFYTLTKAGKESKYFLWKHYMESVIWIKHKV